VSTRILSSTLVAAAAVLACTGAHAAHRLNDTGIGLCIDANGAFIACVGTGQDAESGRDVTHPRDDDGRVGFSFTRLCNSGEPAGEGHCPILPTPGDGPNEWGCTRDDVTGLLWENKTATGLRAGNRMYTFYSPKYDPDGKYGGPHDVTGFLAAVNAAGLCGAHDWRLPSPTELQGIVDMNPVGAVAIDERFFPNSMANFHWASGVVRGSAARRWRSRWPLAATSPSAWATSAASSVNRRGPCASCAAAGWTASASSSRATGRKSPTGRAA
jgi:hypothetical protein